MNERLPSEVEFIVKPLISALGFERLVKEKGESYQVILINRPIILSRVLLQIAHFRKLSSKPKIIYDSEAINALRISGSSGRIKRYLDRECYMAEKADIVWAVSQKEEQIFRKLLKPELPVKVVSHWVKEITVKPLQNRKGILFVGPLYRNGTENHKAFELFVKFILPLLIKEDPGLIFHHVGINYLPMSNLTNVRFHGPLEDPGQMYDTCRLFIAPTLKSSGIPIKLIEAAASGIPVVATSHLATQLGWQHNQHLLVADDPAKFASSCMQLLKDDDLWLRLRDNAAKKVKADFSKSTFSEAVQSSLLKV